MYRRALLALVLLAVVTPSACSQDCVSVPGPSSLLKTSNAVFVGTVTAVTNGIFRFHVTEAFKGVKGNNFEIADAGSMGFTGFQVGRQYLVFASTLPLDHGTTYYIARSCGPTMELKYARATIEQLRAEKKGKRIASVFGMLWRRAPVSDEAYEQPLPGIAVRLRAGQKSYETKTDEYGAYAFNRIPAGTYEISAGLPADLTLSDDIFIGHAPPSFDLPRRSSFDYELSALPTGQIRGHVVAPDGKPLTITSAELYRADLFALNRPGLFASQVDNKPLTFSHLPPGDYVIVFNRQNYTSPDAPFFRTFYPHAQDIQNATRIHLSGGQQISDADIQVKDPIATRKITVHLHWNGRIPTDYYPPQVIIQASEGANPYMARVAPDTYTTNLFLAATYTIRARTFCKSGAKAPVDTAVININGSDTSDSTIDLVFSEGQCLPK